MRILDFLNIAVEDSTIDIHINGEIVSNDSKTMLDWMGYPFETTSHGEFAKLLQKNANKDLTIHVNSYGGEFFAGVAMYNAILEHKGKTTAIVDSVAASAATLPLMACDKVIMNPASTMMIHCVMASLYEPKNKQDLKQEIELLKSLDNAAANAYDVKTMLGRDKILKLMEQETWMDAREAKQLGFVDEIKGNSLDLKLTQDFVQSHRAVYMANTKRQRPTEQSVLDNSKDFEYIKAKIKLGV